MQLPDHPLNCFRHFSIKYVVRDALHGNADPELLRRLLEDLATRADEPAFTKAMARFRLPAPCQPLLFEARTRMQAARGLALRLLERDDREDLKKLRGETEVLDLASRTIYLATQRALGPTPDADVNCILRCVKRRRFGLARQWSQGQFSALEGYGDAPWLVRLRNAHKETVRALILGGQGDKAREPFDLEGALTELLRAAQAAPCHKGPPPKPWPRQPISALWNRHPLSFCYSHVFPEWPWWWLWPTRTLPEVPWNQGGPSLLAG